MNTCSSTRFGVSSSSRTPGAVPCTISGVIGAVAAPASYYWWYSIT